MFFKNKYLLLSLLLCLLVSCNNGCIEANNLGEEGEIDQFVVGSTKDYCSYNNAFLITNSEQSTIIVDCLNNAKLSSVSSYDSNRANLLESSANLTCASIDIVDTGTRSVLKTVSTLQDADKFNLQKTLFNDCLEACRSNCRKQTGDTTSGSGVAPIDNWYRNAVKSNSSFFGLNIDAGSNINVTATGNISLVSENNVYDTIFKDKFYANGGSQTYFKSGTSGTLSITVPNPSSDITSLTNKASLTKLRDIKEAYRTLVFAINPIDGSNNAVSKGGLLDNVDLSNSSANLFELSLSAVSANYTLLEKTRQVKAENITEYKGIYTNNVCVSNFNCLDGLNYNLNNVYNIDNLNMKVFEAGDPLYNYIADTFNCIQYVYNNEEDYGQYEIVETEDHKCLPAQIVNIPSYLDSKKIVINNNVISAYIWDDPDEFDNQYQFGFTLSTANKIALKLLDKTLSGNVDLVRDTSCSYDISYKDKLTDTSYSYSNLTINNDNKWHVLKNNGKEIVFNQYSNSKSHNNVDVVITTSKPECAQALAIQLLPFKEYEVKESGYAFFVIPEFKNNTLLDSSKNEIYYDIINPSILSLGTDQEKIKNFSEFTSSNTGYIFKTKSVLDKDNLAELDSANLLSGASSLSTNISRNGFYVRNKQLIRLDYKSWLEVDDNQDIKIKQWGFSKTSANGTVLNTNVPFGINLLVSIKPRPAYVCRGKAYEQVDASDVCALNSFTSQRMYLTTTCTTDGCSWLTGCVIEDMETANIDNSVKQACNFAEVYKNSRLGEVYVLDQSGSNCTKLEKDSLSLSGTSNTYISFTSYWTYLRNTLASSSKTCWNVYAIDLAAYLNQLSTCMAKLDLNGFKEYNLRTDSNGSSIYIDATGNVTSERLKSLSDALSNTPTYSKVSSIIDELESGLMQSQKLQTRGRVSDDEDESEESSTESVTETKEMYRPTAGIFKSVNNVYGDDYLEITQCYNLEKYTGSWSFFQEQLNNKPSVCASSSKSKECVYYVQNKGLLNDTLIRLGASKFVSDSKVFSPEDFSIEYASNDKTKLVLKKSDFSVKNDSYISSLTVGDQIYLDLSNMPASGTKGDIVLKIGTFENYKNGEQMAVFLGLKDGFEGGAGNTTYTSTKCGVSGPSGSYIDIVKYRLESGRCVLDPNSLYKFSNEGNLMSMYLDKGINLKTATVNQDLVSFVEEKSKESNSNKKLVLFFKILDVDNDISNNTGSYTVRLTNSGVSNKYLITGFSTLVNKVLSLIDGESFKITKDISNKGYEACNGVVDCYYYNADNAKDSNNGAICNKGDKHCYNSCTSITDPELYATRCEYHYNERHGLLKALYNIIISDTLYQFIIKIALITMLVLYGLGYFLGLNNFTQAEIINRLIRVVLVYVLISPNGWNFYNKYVVTFFKQGIDSLLYLIASSFEVNAEQVIDSYARIGDYTDKSVLFTSGFYNLNMLFSSAIFNKILGLTFSGWFGLIYLYLMLSAVISYCVAFINALIMYITAQVFISIVLAIGPLIFIFLFYEKTKKTFDSWLEILIGFSIQQIFIIMTLSFFNSFIYNIIKFVFTYPVCWSTILDLELFGKPISIVSFWKIPSGTNGNSAMNLQATAENGPGFYNIMLLYVVSVLMGKFVSSMAALGNEIGGGIGIGKLSGQATNMVSGMGDKLKSGVASIEKSPLSNMEKKVDAWSRDKGNKFNTQTQERNNAYRQAADFRKAKKGSEDSDRELLESGAGGFKQEFMDFVAGKEKDRAADQGLDSPRSYNDLSDEEKDQYAQQFLSTKGIRS